VSADLIHTFSFILAIRKPLIELSKTIFKANFALKNNGRINFFATVNDANKFPWGTF